MLSCQLWDGCSPAIGHSKLRAAGTMHSIAGKFFVTARLRSMVLLGLCMMMSGLLIGQLLQIFLLDDFLPQEHKRWVFERYGTAYRSIYTLFEITFAGGLTALSSKFDSRKRFAIKLGLTLQTTSDTRSCVFGHKDLVAW